MVSNTIDVCQTGYDYEQYQLNELENDNMKLKKKLNIAKNFIQYVLNKWELDTVDIQDKAEKALKEIDLVGT